MPSSRDSQKPNPLRLITLGGASLLDGAALPVGQQRRRIALLAMVAASGHHGLSRDRLMARLSPDSTPDSARHALHQLLYYLRQQAGEDVFLGTDPLRLNPAVMSSDVADFDQAMARREYAAAAALYHGPFLDGFHLGDSAEFEEWAAGERARLATRYAEALSNLARVADAGGDHNASIEWWRRLTALDPLDGRATLGLLRALAAAGDAPGAVRHARAYTGLVRAELGRDPDPEIVAFIAALPREARTEPAPRAESLAVPHTSRPSRSRLRPMSLVLAAGCAALLVTAGLFWRAGKAERTTPIGRLAVLPLVNGSDDSTVTAIAAALTQELIASLSSAGLQVLGYYTVAKYGGTRPPIAEIGKDLRVDAVATWTVLRREGRWRVSLEVSRAPSGEGLWSSTAYVVDSLQLPDVAYGAARELASRFAPAAIAADRRFSLRRSPGSPEARIAYLIGMDRLWKGPRGFDTSLSQFRRAIAADSSFAPAFAGMGYLLIWTVDYGKLPLHEACNRARPVIERALVLDPDLALARIARARMVQHCEWNWKEAEAEYRRAISLEHTALTYHHYGWFLEWWLGRAREGVAMADTALALEPGSPLQYIALGWRLRGAGELERAEEAARTAMALQPGAPDGHGILIEVYLQRGDYAAAEREALAMKSMQGTAPSHWRLGEIYARTGRAREARNYMSLLAKEVPQTSAARLAFARTQMALGDRQGALRTLESAVNDGIFIIPHQAYWAPIRADPRFQALMGRMGL